MKPSRSTFCFRVLLSGPGRGLGRRSTGSTRSTRDLRTPAPWPRTPPPSSSRDAPTGPSYAETPDAPLPT